MKIFDLDSPFMQWLNKFANLMFLNLLTLITMIPIVTIGASLTAMNYVALKIVRDEDYYVTKSFFKSFKQNFKQATGIWFIFFIIGAVLGADFYILNNIEGLPLENVLKVVIGAIAIVVALAFVFVFPLLSKFDNTVKKTVKNAFMIGLYKFPIALVMVVLYALLLIVSAIDINMAMRIFPIFIFFGLSAPAYVGALMYNKFFKKLEDRINENNASGEEPEEASGDDERIFHDELDTSIVVDEDGNPM